MAALEADTRNVIARYGGHVRLPALVVAVVARVDADGDGLSKEDSAQFGLAQLQEEGIALSEARILKQAEPVSSAPSGRRTLQSPNARTFTRR
jgi:hypothetical protein